MAVAALALVWSTALLAGRRRWDAAMLALAPALVVHAMTNWDLAAAALAGLAMLAWARRRPVLAGVLLGLATATKLYPALFLSLIHISEPTRLLSISYAVFCLKKKKNKNI